MPTRYPGTPAETVALDAYIKLMRAGESLTARAGGVMAADGLTIGQFGVLEALLHRFVTVMLTPRGRRLIREIFPRHVAGLVREMGVLARAELEALGGLCRRLGLGEGESVGWKGERRWRTNTRQASARSGTTRR